MSTLSYKSVFWFANLLLFFVFWFVLLEHRLQFLMVFEEEQLLDCLMKFMNRYMTKERPEPKSTSKTTRVSYVDDVDEPLPYFPLTDKHNNLLCFTANFIELGNIYLECVRAKQQTLHFVVSTVSYYENLLQSTISDQDQFRILRLTDIFFLPLFLSAFLYSFLPFSFFLPLRSDFRIRLYFFWPNVKSVLRRVDVRI